MSARGPPLIAEAPPAANPQGMPQAAPPPAPTGPPIDPGDLAKAVSADYRALNPFRLARHDMIAEAQGQYFGKGDGQRRPINLIAQCQSILLPYLVDENGKHRARTARAELRSQAVLLELALDHLHDELDYLTTKRQVCLDALLGCCGIVRVGMHQADEAVKVNDGLDDNEPRAKPYVCRIDFDDYVFDTTARNRREMFYEGHRYRISRKDAIESGIFGHDPAPGEPPIDGLATTAEALDILRSCPKLDDSQLKEGEGSGLRDPERWRLNEVIELWDVAVYDGKQTWIVTLAGNHEKSDVAQSAKWLMCHPHNAPRHRPYLAMGFVDASNSPLFVPGVAMIRDLHEAAKTVSNKVLSQITKAKVVHTYRPDAQDEADTIKNAPDGEWVKVRDPQAIGNVEDGGIVKELMPALDWIKGEFADQSGNLPMTGGQDSGATDGTATAAQYLQANATLRIRSMQSRVSKFDNEVDKFLAAYLLTDPAVNLPLPYRLPGGESITVDYTPARRQGCADDFSFEIVQFTETGMDPNVRIKRVVEFLTMVTNMIPLIQGGLVNIHGLNMMGREEFGIENLDELINDPMLMAQSQQTYGAVPMPGKAPVAGMGPPNGAGQSQSEQTSSIDAGRSAMSVGVGQ